MEQERFKEDILFAHQHCPDDFIHDYERYLYNEVQYLKLQTGQFYLSFYVLNTKDKKVLGRIHFFVESAVAQSSYKSPFGGLEINPKLSLDLIAAFIAFYEKSLMNIGVKSMTIKQFPFCYAEVSATKLTNSYLRAGYQLTHPDLNHHIPVDDTDFAQKAHPMERRKLKKAQSKSLVFYEEPNDNLEGIYKFIQARRKEKGQSLNVSFAYLKRAMEALPNTYKIFTVKAGEEIIAVSVIVLVNERIAYNFLPASSTLYNKWSPMVFLLAGIYEWCKSASIEILDLGISAVDNAPQYSLLQFKERIGGKASLKCTFSKKINNNSLRNP